MKTFLEYHKDSGLGKWLDEKWVDISRKDKKGKHPPCGASAKKEGRHKSQKKKYPKCRPASQAGKMSEKLKGNKLNVGRKHMNDGQKNYFVNEKDIQENNLFHLVSGRLKKNLGV